MKIDIDGAVHFHGHLCAGLAVGIRVAEMALRELGERAPDEELVAVAETRACSVDAVQYLTGCTLGKGNLMLLDYGKNAFRFYRRADGKALRVRQRSDAFPPLSPEDAAAQSALRAGTATAEQRQRAMEYQNWRLERLLSMPLDDLIVCNPISAEMPPFAKMFDSVACDRCGEKTQETLLTLYHSRAYCPECFALLMQDLP